MKLTKRLVCAMLSLMMVASLAMAPATSLTAEAKSKSKTTTTAASKVTIMAAVINGANVVVTTSGTVASEDGLYHLYAQDANMSGVQGLDVAQAPAANGATFTIPLGKDTANSMLFKKFVIVVVKGGVPTAVSNSMYITNPEACAKNSIARTDVGKKGLLASTEAGNMNANYVGDLGVNQVTLSLPLSKITNGTDVPFSYNGKSYNFTTKYIYGFDAFIRQCNSRNIQVTVIILVDAASNISFINPYSYAGMGTAHYLGLNANTTDGVEILEAASAYLATRWSGSGHGNVDNYIIGNEVNAWSDWNYMNCGSVDAFATEYANAFRIMYNGIKSVNGLANVYVCTDQQWAKASASTYFGSRPFLTAFNNKIRSEGNIDWRLATHAYNVPLTDPQIWVANKNLTHSQSTPFVSIQNIDVVTDFLTQADFLSPTGQVRTVKLSEQGYTSSAGQELQAVAVTYAYLVAMNNSHIDGLIISREKDDIGEIAQGLANGLMDVSNNKKLAYDYYKNAGNPTYIAQASALAGVDLNTLITPR